MSHFTALAVPGAITASLREWVPTIPAATFTHPDDYHLTLKYLGTPPPAVLQEFLQVAASVPAEPLVISLKHLHVLKRTDLHFLVALTELTQQLHRLHLAHEAVATSLGLEPYAFPNFLPHITLASYPPQAVDISTSPLNLAFVAESCTLYQSNRPHNTGVGRYTPHHTWALGPS